MMMLLDVFVSMRHITIGPKKKTILWEAELREQDDGTTWQDRTRIKTTQ